MADNLPMEPATTSRGLFNRTLRRFRRAWRGAGLGSAELKDLVAPDVSSADSNHLREQFRACLEARSGEIEARARAAALGATYLSLNETGKRRFLDILANDFDIDETAIAAAIDTYQDAIGTKLPVDTDADPKSDDEGVKARHRALQQLRDALVAPRVRLLTRFNELSLGVKFLVDMRADILQMKDRSPQLAELERDLKTLLLSWFDIGFLDLTRITWNTPAAVLEKLIEYEAVHAIRSWDDLKDRLEDDRRCYAFFHPCMPDEPLIFVEVALVDGLTGNIHELLDPSRTPRAGEAADTAIFYSISNCQSGLAGVSFGNFLIKRVASDLARELPGVKTFSTLSPIPGFRRWLINHIDQPDPGLELSETHRSSLSDHGSSPEEVIRTVIESPRMLVDAEHAKLAETLAPIARSLCARYLLTAKRGQQAQDRVAHFHLSNGARVERLNWLGDRSASGLDAALGMMVNYRYVLSDVDKNHEAYMATGKVVATSQVQKTFKG